MTAATLDDTVIEDGVKLDNQIQIAHNVKIGANTAIAACVGIAGSATIGRNCALGGAAMLCGHITIADNVSVSAGTLVMKSLAQPGDLHRRVSVFDASSAGFKTPPSCGTSTNWRTRARTRSQLGKEKGSQP